MSIGSKDSKEVTQFMMLFARLKSWCDDLPSELAEMAAKDSSVEQLSSSLGHTTFFLSRAERRHRTLFAAPTDPSFIAAWRDYEARYRAIVEDIWMNDFLPDLPAVAVTSAPDGDRLWNRANMEGEYAKEGLQEVIDFAAFNLDQDRDFEEGFAQRLLEGISAWKELESEIGFDVQAVVRRRNLVPFVLVPRRLANKLGSVEKLNLLKTLQQAHDAFVFGAPYAAIALMRSIVEALLRDHYGADGKDLDQRIRNAQRKLPKGANEAALHRLRKLANVILHFDPERDEGVARMDEKRLEKEIVSLLVVVRALIEGVK